MRRKSDFLSSFLPSCEWHKSPKINLSVEWKASWGASDWTSIIYGISRGWHHGSRGRGGEINRVIAVNSATYTAASAMHYNFRTLNGAPPHPSAAIWSTDFICDGPRSDGAGGLIYEEGGRGTETAKRSEQSAK